jgi:beta-glucosidase
MNNKTIKSRSRAGINFISCFVLFQIFLTILPVKGFTQSLDDILLDRIDNLINRMTLQEKIGQMCQFNGFNGEIPDKFRKKIKAGLIGSVLNEVNPETINEMQRIAVEESRLGIPLLIGRDVIHGFKTILPIPLGQAASWNPDLIEAGARMAAMEARSVGINWTFAPMVDITRDPRWGRIAESLGEDPYLTSQLAGAMVRGFQGDNLGEHGHLAACAKHFAGYGAAEGGRDYNTANIPENELRDVYLPSFRACVDNGVTTIMSAFNDINGIPATGNEMLLDQILRQEWMFKGFVVSDWESVIQQVTHGFTPDKKTAAAQAIKAGVDMEMASTSYADYIPELVKSNRITEAELDEAVRRILLIKFRMNLFENPYTNPSEFPELVNDEHRAVARKIATQSVVLLKNENQILPITKKIKTVAVIGPLADAPYEQLGTWIFDGDKNHSITPYKAIQQYQGGLYKVNFAKGLEISRTKDQKGFPEAVESAKKSDLVILFLGEESILSGESHSRADINLPGAQTELVNAIYQTGKPIIAVILAGRPLTIRPILNKVQAILYAWHPGTMAGPAIADLLFGAESPSGKLPVTFPTHVGQIPIYYAHKNTGKPATKESWVRMDDIPVEVFQLSIGNTSHYLDEGYEPLFPFGYGLSYTIFEYEDIKLNKSKMTLNDKIEVSAIVSNRGMYDAEEIVQLYVRDLYASRIRPVKELKGFKRINLRAGESKTVSFEIKAKDLSFYNEKMERVTEPGIFHVWIGGNSNTQLRTEFEILD